MHVTGIWSKPPIPLQSLASQSVRFVGFLRLRRWSLGASKWTLLEQKWGLHLVGQELAVPSDSGVKNGDMGWDKRRTIEARQKSVCSLVAVLST